MRQPPMTTATSNNKPAWHAEVRWENRSGTRKKKIRKGQLVKAADGELVNATEDKTVEEDYSTMVRVVHVFRPESECRCDRIRFQVNEHSGPEITFSDPRERAAGTAGVTGIWGTLPAPPVYKPRPLTLAAFRVELTRLVGATRAEEIIRTITSPDFFCNRL
jgi:hypothetical protein